ncbi:MAG: hypothetical protein QNK23_01060 [Crocinitomicaceae bacterium]|nr:hypothetical protein [Crocinitomicaceae bacterium]
MKHSFLLFSLLFVTSVAFAQDDQVSTTPEPTKKEKVKKKKKQPLTLTNAVIIGQMDKPQDRYSIEIMLTEMMTSRQMPAVPSLNIMKIGADAQIMASDSIKEILTAKGIDTYMLVTVRGYDRRFKVAAMQEDLSGALNTGSLFELYRTEIVSVSFEFKFYRGGEFIFGDMIKCGSVSDREQVLKKFRSKVQKRMDKKWRV